MLPSSDEQLRVHAKSLRFPTSSLKMVSAPGPQDLWTAHFLRPHPASLHSPQTGIGEPFKHTGTARHCACGASEERTLFVLCEHHSQASPVVPETQPGAGAGWLCIL